MNKTDKITELDRGNKINKTDKIAKIDDVDKIDKNKNTRCNLSLE